MNESDHRGRGQVLVLFVLLLTAILGMAALAIDVSGAYAELRHERTAADAAALAAASDNFRAGSTVVDNTEWTRARKHAMETLVSQLAPPATPLPGCGGSYASDIVNCAIAGTPYYVSIKVPSPSCGPCDTQRSAQVTIRSPRYGLTFARLFGQFSWNLPITSVAERSLGANYTFVTLRPPKPSRANDPGCSPVCDSNDDDVFLQGTTTKLTVHGDMGTNTNMQLTNGASVVLDSGNYVYRYDGYKAWVGAPADKQLSGPIPDPGYAFPTRPSNVALIYGDEPSAEMSVAACTSEVTANMPTSYSVSTADISSGVAVCYKPGVYSFRLNPPAQVTTVVFTPGVYFVDGGFQVGSTTRVIGGYAPNVPGVALVFPNHCSPACTFAGNSSPLVALNAGAAYPTGSGGAATAAINWDGAPVQTNGRVPLPMTLLVQRDMSCLPVGVTDSVACQNDENQNGQLRLPGGGSLFAFGVQFAPTDNVQISGGAASAGYLGQIWAWTVKYTGGSNITLTSASNPQAGVLRIATPCSPGASCTNPEATAAIP